MSYLGEVSIAWDSQIFTPGAEEPGIGSGSPAGSTAILERSEERVKPDDGDADRFAHYVRMDRIQRSLVTGQPVVALCGKVWTPSAKRDPSKYPPCPTCVEIKKRLQGGGGSEGGSDGFFGSGGFGK